MYPSEWKGSSIDKAGIATFKIEGKTFTIQLDCFYNYKMVSDMLELAFEQGKHFAKAAISSHIMRALKQAETDHGL